MPNYSKGKIYTIRFFDNDKLIYIGSTIQPLSVRFSGHKRSLDISLHQYIQTHYNGDFKCCYIELYELCECNNKEELNKKEGEVIRKFQIGDYIVINKYIAGGNNKDKDKEKEKEYNKQYYIENADKIKERAKKYSKENADKVQEYQQLKYLRNAEYYKEKAKQRYEMKKDEINEKRRIKRQ